MYPVCKLVPIGFDVGRSQSLKTLHHCGHECHWMVDVCPVWDRNNSARFQAGDVETAHEDWTQLGCAVFRNPPKKCHAVQVPSNGCS